MVKPGDNVSNGRFGGVPEFAMSIQVHLGECDRVNAAEASAGIAKAYLDELTSIGLEGWE